MNQTNFNASQRNYYSTTGYSTLNNSIPFNKKKSGAAVNTVTPIFEDYSSCDSPCQPPIKNTIYAAVIPQKLSKSFIIISSI